MSSSNIKKGMVFAGCSFTWGQGLYFYSKMSTLDYSNTNSFSVSKVNHAHVKYMESFRFPRLVANHFDTFEIVKHYNGGCDDDSIDFVNSIFHDPFSVRFNPNNIKIEYDEISHIIFQTSDLIRNFLHFNHNDILYKSLLGVEYEFLVKWMDENKMDFSHVKDMLLNQVFLRIKDFFIKYEEKGITCKLLCWRDDFIDMIKFDPFFDGKLIKLEYEDKQYDCLDYLIKANNGMSIGTDSGSLGKYINDDHPSKQCHRLIADSIIKHIEKENI